MLPGSLPARLRSNVLSLLNNLLHRGRLLNWWLEVVEDDPDAGGDVVYAKVDPSGLGAVARSGHSVRSSRANAPAARPTETAGFRWQPDTWPIA